MADKSTQIVLEALSRAVADPEGAPLHGGKASPGLFPTTAPAKQAAQRAKDEGYLKVVGSQTRGKVVLELCAITEKGVQYLLNQVSPRLVLEDLVRAVEARQAQMSALVDSARKTQACVEGLKAAAEKILTQVQQQKTSPALLPCDKSEVSSNGARGWIDAALQQLTRWRASGSTEDCPLPELYRLIRQTYPALTIGQFHDGLRRLHEQEQIYLHPWTGPLYDLPDPPYALLIGHVVAYYATLR